MKWGDYRELLGIGFSDNEKALLLRNRLSVLIDGFDHGSYRDEETIMNYFITVCERPEQHYAWYEVQNSIERAIDIPSLVSKGVALTIAMKKSRSCGLEQSKAVEDYLVKTLYDLNIPFEVIRDEDGMFIFPKGAQELDEGCVSRPFRWLQMYPRTQRAMRLALEAYTNKEDPSNTADLFRKALETFSQEFLGSNKSLENLRTAFGTFMKSKGVPSELSSNIESVLQMYTNYMNSYAKHKDGTAEIFLEFIMYHTGNIIRFMISLKGHVSQIPTN